jgi:hypothetical protein
MEFIAQYSRFTRQEEIKLKYIVFLPDEKTPANMWAFAIDCILREVR